MARKYEVEGTKNFLIWAILLLLLGLWCVKDGWFPSETVAAKHPPEEDRGFYLFNQTLAVLCLVGSVVCTYIHYVVK